jgi:hypothetical protein
MLVDKQPFHAATKGDIDAALVALAAEHLDKTLAATYDDV